MSDSLRKLGAKLLQEKRARKYGLRRKDGVESYADFHINRLSNHDIFRHLISFYSHKPDLRFMEVGCFEGVSTVFFLKNILTNPSSKIVCIDPLGQKPKKENELEGYGHDPEVDPLREKTPKTVFEVFSRNVLEKYSDQVIFHREKSDIALRRYREPEFDVIYLDGLHYATAVLSDLVMSWPLLKKGGYMLLDDFGMSMDKNRLNLDASFFGISAFMNVFQGQFEVVSGLNYLITLKKVVESSNSPPSSYL
jgi:predicted O-methyltransferase YrrM